MEPSEALEIIELGYPTAKLQEAEEVSRQVLRDVVSGRYVDIGPIVDTVIENLIHGEGGHKNEN